MSTSAIQSHYSAYKTFDTFCCLILLLLRRYRSEVKPIIVNIFAARVYENRIEKTFNEFYSSNWSMAKRVDFSGDTHHKWGVTKSIVEIITFQTNFSDTVRHRPHTHVLHLFMYRRLYRWKYLYLSVRFDTINNWFQIKKIMKINKQQSMITSYSISIHRSNPTRNIVNRAVAVLLIHLLSIDDSPFSINII